MRKIYRDRLFKAVNGMWETIDQLYNNAQAIIDTIDDDDSERGGMKLEDYAESLRENINEIKCDRDFDREFWIDDGEED